jgi:hypothetical protein
MRNTVNKFLWAIAFTSVITLIPTHYAYAYLDPGTGSFLLQLLLAGLLGVLFTLRLFRDKIVSFVRNVFRRNADTGKQETVLTEDIGSLQE